MAKARGHRANKPNDSFGAINNESLYRGKHRDAVYIDDDEEETKQKKHQRSKRRTPKRPLRNKAPAS